MHAQRRSQDRVDGQRFPLQRPTGEVRHRGDLQRARVEVERGGRLRGFLEVQGGRGGQALAGEVHGRVPLEVAGGGLRVVGH